MQTMKIIHQLLIVTFFLGLSFSIRGQNYSNQVNIKYLDLEKFANSSKQFILYFKIKNNTNDTLYLSRKNIIIKVTNKGKSLENERNTSIGQVIFRASKKNKSKIDAENLQDEKTALLRHNFAEKLYYKNFAKDKVKRNKEFVVRVIENDCIVILPNATVNYSQIFINSLFNRNCKINARYLNNKIFTYYMAGDENKINIKS